MDEAQPTPNAPVLMDPFGRPARRSTERSCPKCGADPDKRVLSAGFGFPHDVCSKCGHEFQERTR